MQPMSFDFSLFQSSHSGSPEQSATGTSFTSSTRVDRSCFGAKERSNTGGNSGATPSRANVSNPTRGHGFPTRESSAVGFEGVREVFAGSPVWLFSRPWGMHKRDAPRLLGRSRVVPVVVLCQRRFHQRHSSTHGGPSVDGGHHDSIAETRRGGERNRHRHGFQEARCQVSGTTVCQNCGISLFTIPIRTVHQSGNRLRGPHHPSPDANPALTVTSIDGVGAYDHVHRSAMLS